jgi:uncharacterized protein YbjT (DUF2867 family)
MNQSRKIVVIGGTGLVGSKIVPLLRSAGHDVVVASPRLGIDVITGHGLLNAMKNADIVIDTSNIQSFDGEVVRSFFAKSAHNLIAAELQSKVSHHVTLSIVGTDALTSNGYIQGKYVQENAIRGSGLPHTIVRATQFFELLPTIADAFTVEGVVQVPECCLQPIAADDVALFMANVALGEPRNGIVEIAGPERAPFAEMVERYLRYRGDRRAVESADDATYFGTPVSNLSLVPQAKSSLGTTTLEHWLPQQRSAA